MAATSQAALQQDVVQLQAETATLQRQLESTLADFDRIQAEARRVELDVVEEVSFRNSAMLLAWMFTNLITKVWHMKVCNMCA